MIRLLNAYRFELTSLVAIVTNSVVSRLEGIEQLFQVLVLFLTFIVLFLTAIKMIAQGLEKHFGIDFFHYFRKKDRKNQLE